MKNLIYHLLIYNTLKHFYDCLCCKLWFLDTYSQNYNSINFEIL